MVAAPTRIATTPKAIPVFIVVGALSMVGGYVRSQLKTQSNSMDRFFAQYNNPESEASRQKTFEGVQDPRRSLFNVLSW